MWDRIRKQERPLRRGALGLVVALYLAYALWGIAAPFAWGHYGFHGGFHGAAARNLVRHGAFTPTPHVGQSAPPKEARYLHHPILCPQYLVPVQAVFGESEWTLRLVPVLFTLALVLGVAWAGARLWGPWAGVLAALVFALLPHNMVFCHLFDHETPGNLYALFGVTAFLLFLRRPRWPLAALCLGGFLLAGLTDWPPYFIAFALAWAGAGHLLTATVLPHRPHRVFVWAAGMVPLFAFSWWLLASKAAWPAWQIHVVMFLLVLAGLVGGVAATVGPRGPWRPLVLRWGLLAGVSVVVVVTFWFHFKYTAWVGMADDLEAAFKVRSAGSDAWRYVAKYFDNVRHTFTTPLLLVTGLWLASIPARIALGRPLLGAVLPLVFLVGQVMHNLQFPNEVDIHNYRTYYFVVTVTFAFVDVVWEGAALTGWLIGRLRGGGPTWSRPAAYGVLAGLVGGVLLWTAMAAAPVLVEGRKRSGTLRFFAPYHPQLDKALVFAEIRKRTDPKTVVLYTYDVGPRFEALWYLDRDVRKVTVVPATRRSAERLAAFPVGHRGRRRRADGAASRAPARRDAVIVLPARVGRRYQRSVDRLRVRVPVVRLGPWLLIDYRGEGASYRAYRVVHRRWRSWLERWIAGPHRPRALRRDLWDEWRVAGLVGLPFGGRPVLRHPPRRGAGRDDWLAWLNARRVAGDVAGARTALVGLRRHLRVPKDDRLSPRLRLLGSVTGRTRVALFVDAREAAPAACRLRFESRRPGGRIRTWTHDVHPHLTRWPKGAAYVVSVPHRSRGGAPRSLRVSRCEGAYPTADTPAAISLTDETSKP